MLLGEHITPQRRLRKREKETSMSNKENTALAFGADIQRLPLKDLLKRIGPGAITTLIWRKDVNEGYKAPTALRICMTISYLFVLVMTASSLIKLFS